MRHPLHVSDRVPFLVPSLDDTPALFAIDPDPIGDRDDAEWFREHPTRCHRLRPAIGAELSIFGKPTDPSHVPSVIVRQTAPGLRSLLAVWSWYHDLDADELACHALFDHTLRLKRGGPTPPEWLTLRLRQLRQVSEAVVQ